jgi:hypothetical protein
MVKRHIVLNKDYPFAQSFPAADGGLQELRAYTVDSGAARSVAYTYDELKGDNWQTNLKVGN